MNIQKGLLTDWVFGVPLPNPLPCLPLFSLAKPTIVLRFPPSSHWTQYRRVPGFAYINGLNRLGYKGCQLSQCGTGTPSYPLLQHERHLNKPRWQACVLPQSFGYLRYWTLSSHKGSERFTNAHDFLVHSFLQPRRCSTSHPHSTYSMLCNRVLVTPSLHQGHTSGKIEVVHIQHSRKQPPR